MNEALYPYIFTEELYVFSTKNTTDLPIVEKKAVESEKTDTPAPVVASAPALREVQSGQSSALCVVFWGASYTVSTEDQELLNKILQACKLNPNDIAVWHAQPSEGLLFTDEIPASKALVFCDDSTLKTATQAKLNLYQPQTVSGKQLLLSNPLPALSQQTPLKANLWKALQSMMGI